MTRHQTYKERRWFSLLLLIPFIALLWPAYYNTYDPVFLGMPFFYWYQILWIFLTALLTIIVYFTGA